MYLVTHGTTSPNPCQGGSLGQTSLENFGFLLAPLLQADLRMEFSSLVCLDASESGGAVAISNVLSAAGADLTNRLRRPELEPIDAELLVISAFNGIGGAFRAYDLQGVRPAHIIAIEIDKAAQRTTRAWWPRVLEVSDIHLIDLTMVSEWANTFPRVKQAYLGWLSVCPP